MPIGPFRTSTAPINVGSLDRFDEGAEVTPESLVEKGLLKNTKTDVKLLGNGDLKKKLTVRVHGISATARAKVEKAGGTVSLLKEPKVKKRKKHAKPKPAAAAPAPETAETPKAAKTATEAAPEAENVAPEPESTEEQAPEVE
jgi:ribosomal protein L18E